MSEVVLEGALREEKGKGSARSFRREGKVPGVYYKKGEQSLHFTVDAKTLRQLIDGETHIISLKINGSSYDGIIKDLQFDPVTNAILHLDVQGIDMKKAIRVNLPVELVGKSIGAKLGGIVELLTRELEVECMPSNLPDSIKVDISELDIGDSVHVEDISIEDVIFHARPDAIVVNVVPPKTQVLEEEAVEEEAVDEEAAEPEVVGKGKEKEEDADEEQS